MLPKEEPPRRQGAKKSIEPSKEHDRVAREIVHSAFAVHDTLGPGLLESVYERCLVCELAARGLAVERQISAPLIYRHVRIDAGFRMDMLVNSLVVVEIKAVESVLPIHEAQLLTYFEAFSPLPGSAGQLQRYTYTRWFAPDCVFALSLAGWRLGGLSGG